VGSALLVALGVASFGLRCCYFDLKIKARLGDDLTDEELDFIGLRSSAAVGPPMPEVCRATQRAALFVRKEGGRRCST
jgi:hypothetical protein